MFFLPFQVISELIETERTYVSNLSIMIKLYFQPLQDASFLSKTEVTSLFGNIQDIHSFQQEFLQSMEEAVEQEGDLESIATPKQLKVYLYIVFILFYFNSTKEHYWHHNQGQSKMYY